MGSIEKLITELESSILDTMPKGVFNIILGYFINPEMFEFSGTEGGYSSDDFSILIEKYSSIVSLLDFGAALSFYIQTFEEGNYNVFGPVFTLCYETALFRPFLELSEKTNKNVNLLKEIGFSKAFPKEALFHYLSENHENYSIVLIAFQESTVLDKEKFKGNVVFRDLFDLSIRLKTADLMVIMRDLLRTIRFEFLSETSKRFILDSQDKLLCKNLYSKAIFLIIRILVEDGYSRKLPLSKIMTNEFPLISLGKMKRLIKMVQSTKEKDGINENEYQMIIGILEKLAERSSLEHQIKKLTLQCD